MLRKYSGSTTPPSLRGPMLVDSAGLPRFWVTVWSLYVSADLANSSKEKLLRHIESLYEFADQLKGAGSLDDAIAEINIELLGEILESYFITFQNQSVINQSAQLKWQTAFQFVRDTVLRLSKSNLPLSQIHEIEGKLNRLTLLYQQLRIGKKRQQEIIRSLPAGVVEELYSMLDPESFSNPFGNMATKWKVYVIFIILLHQGLRRGELLLQPADAVKSGFDKKFNKDRFWLSVVYNPYEEDDSRYSKPGVKTPSSIRQMPVSALTANIIQEYVENYRGKVNHSFLISSQKGKPLSTEALTCIFKKITLNLSKVALHDLKQRTGKESITPHDLRHTCAVVRLNQLLERGKAMDEALQEMRTFFGWSRSSDMPQKYARAVFEDRLAGIWNNVFDDRVSILRAIPESRT
ncbi:MAG: site-specific integrase [Gallionella sp.]|nr:site-specific integrase [Gallionella sp.]